MRMTRADDERLLAALDRARSGVMISMIADEAGMRPGTCWQAMRRVALDDKRHSGEPARNIAPHYPAGWL